MDFISKPIVLASPVADPTSNENERVESINVLPAHVVTVAILSTSSERLRISSDRFALSCVLLVSLADWTAISRMRWRIFSISLWAPSDVSIRAWPSSALRIDCPVVAISDVSRDVIAVPAASSADELMRLPVDMRVIAVCISALAEDAEADAWSAALDVGIANAMSFLLKVPLCGAAGSPPTSTTEQTVFVSKFTLSNDPLSQYLVTSSKKCKIYVSRASSRIISRNMHEYCKLEIDLCPPLLVLVVIQRSSNKTPSRG